MKFYPLDGNRVNNVTPSPKGFIMHNKLYVAGSLEERNMWWRYTRLTNKPRYFEEVRPIGSVYGLYGDRFR